MNAAEAKARAVGAIAKTEQGKSLAELEAVLLTSLIDENIEDVELADNMKQLVEHLRSNVVGLSDAFLSVLKRIA